MNPIEQAAGSMFYQHHHHDQEQEQHMSSQPFSMAGHLHRLGDLIDANPLVSRLLAAGLGSCLTDADAGHITAIVASIEQVRREQAQQTPAQPYDSGQYLVPGTAATYTPRETAVAAYDAAPDADGSVTVFPPAQAQN